MKSPTRTALITVALGAVLTSTITAGTSASFAAERPLKRATSSIALALATTSTTTLQPTTMWGSASPSGQQDSDTAAVTLATKFVPQVDGKATGVRFFKTSGNTGTHVGTLWSASGQKLASVTFSAETATGWQSASFASPVALTKGTTYLISYHAPVGRYIAASPSLGGSQSAYLSVSGGQFAYGSTPTFPSKTWNNSQYFVDVTFSPASALATTTSPTTTAPAPTTTTPTTTTPAPTTPTTTTTPAPSTTTPTTTTPTATGKTKCAALPSACGYPDATNTGATGTLLNVPGQVTSGDGWYYDSRGWIAVNKPGAVLQNISTSLNIDVTADNVTIRNVKLNAPKGMFGISIRHAKNVVVEKSTISGGSTGTDRLMVGIKTIYGDEQGTIVRGNNIYHVSTGVQLDDGLIENNYIHDMGYADGDHVNGTTANGGTSPLVIRHNTVSNQFSQTDCISLFQDFGNQANKTIDDNLIAGGGFSVYAGQNAGGGQTYNIKVTNNRVSRMYFPKGGYYGWLAAYSSTGSGNVMSGNVWDEDNTPA